MRPSETFGQHRPRKGDPVKYGEKTGMVTSVEGEICWVDYPKGTDSFIWCFKDGLNKLHDWPTKAAKD
jgi:hypothetical protein